MKHQQRTQSSRRRHETAHQKLRNRNEELLLAGIIKEHGWRPGFSWWCGENGSVQAAWDYATAEESRIQAARERLDSIAIGIDIARNDRKAIDRGRNPGSEVMSCDPRI
jgi:hypothetical protein